MDEKTWIRVKAIYARANELQQMGYFEDARKKYHEAYALLTYDFENLNQEQRNLYYEIDEMI